MTKEMTSKIGTVWKNSSYYENHESEALLNLFWGDATVFKRMFSTLDPENIVEIACGHGRHVQKYKQSANTITLVDINQENINICKERFKDDSNIIYIVNDGSTLKEISSESKTSVFSYDAMVHFEMMDMIGYIQEIHRVLKKNGKALIHHSNNGGNPGGDPMWHPTWRNFMSADIFSHIASRSGFAILEQQLLHWGGFNNIDCVTLLQKQH